MKRDLPIIVVFSLILIVIGEILAQANYLPAVDSDKGVAIDHAFRVLMMFGVPVFAIVAVTLVYLVLRYRASGDPTADGPAQHGRNFVPIAWVGVTSALAVTLMIYPGLTELPAIVDNPANPDLVVQVQSVQWAWTITYPKSSVVVHDELVLPLGQNVQFQLTSKDVIHDFWIPAFRYHMDAVPGMTTLVTLRPTQLGTHDQDPDLRLQCAQLCGLGHAVMTMPVRVVSGPDFAAWLIQKGAKATASNNQIASSSLVGTQASDGGNVH